jgi:dCTP diphosphatase
VNDLGDAIRAIIEVRYWEQCHSPKILAMILSVEMSEVIEHFQWLT